LKGIDYILGVNHNFIHRLTSLLMCQNKKYYSYKAGATIIGKGEGKCKSYTKY